MTEWMPWSLCDSCARLVATGFQPGHDGHRRRGFCAHNRCWMELGVPRQLMCWRPRGRRLRMPWPDATEAEVTALATLASGCARRCGADADRVAESLLRVLGWTYGQGRRARV